MDPRISRFNEIKTELRTITSNITENITRAWGHIVKALTPNQTEPTLAKTHSTFQTVMQEKSPESPTIELQGENANEPPSRAELQSTHETVKSSLDSRKAIKQQLETDKTNLAELLKQPSGMGDKNHIVIRQNILKLETQIKAQEKMEEPLKKELSELEEKLAAFEQKVEEKPLSNTQLKELPKTPAELQKTKSEVQQTRAALALQKAKSNAAETKKTGFEKQLQQPNGLGSKNHTVIRQQLAKVNTEIKQINEELQSLQSKLDSFGIKKTEIKESKEENVKASKEEPQVVQKSFITSSNANTMKQPLTAGTKSLPIKMMPSINNPRIPVNSDADPQEKHIVSSKPVQDIPEETISKILDELSVSNANMEDADFFGDIDQAFDDAFEDLKFDIEEEAVTEMKNPVTSNSVDEKEKTAFTNLKTKLESISKRDKLKLRDGTIRVKERNILNAGSRNSLLQVNIFNPDAGEKGIKTMNEVLDRLTSFTKNAVVPTAELYTLLTTLENQEWTKAPLKDDSTGDKLTTIKNHLENKMTYEKLLAAHGELEIKFATEGGFLLKELDQLEQQIYEVQDALKTTNAYLNELK